MMKLFKKSAIEIVGYNPYSELVFGGWDYNIENKESAILKSKSILKVGIYIYIDNSRSYLPTVSLLTQELHELFQFSFPMIL